MSLAPLSPLPPEVPYLFGTKTMPVFELSTNIAPPNPLELINEIKKYKKGLTQ